MDIVKILRKAESKLVKEASRVTGQLASVRAAIQTLGGKTSRAKRKMSAAGRAKIAKAQRARWAKVKKERAKS
jgi:hypothetical protein